MLRSTLLAIVVCIATQVVAAQGAHARDDGRFGKVPQDIKDWIEGLKNKIRAPCCATADGFQPEEVEWDTDRRGYRVRISGLWYEVPDYAVIEESNRLGYAIVWYSKRRWAPLPPPDDLVIICFLPGSGS